MRFPLVLVVAAAVHSVPLIWYARPATPPVRHAVLGEVSVELMPAPSSPASRHVESKPTPQDETPEKPNEKDPVVPPAVPEKVALAQAMPELVEKTTIEARPPEIEKPRFEVPPELERIRFVKPPPPRPRTPLELLQMEQPVEQSPTIPASIHEKETPTVEMPRFENTPVEPRPMKFEKPRFEIPPEVERIRFVKADPPKPRNQPMPKPSQGSAPSQGSDGRQRGEKIPPKVANTIRPKYPETAQLNGWEGTVTVWVKITEKGEVVETRVEKSSGHEILDMAARDYARQLRFDPAKEDGKPVETTGSFDVRYRLR